MSKVVSLSPGPQSDAAVVASLRLFTRASLRFGLGDVTFTLSPAPGFDRRAMQEDNVLTQSTAAVSGKTAPDAAMKGIPGTVSSDALLEQILTSLDDDKAEDVVTIDLRGKSTIADHMVIATGRSSRQVVSIAEKLTDLLKQKYGIICKVEGKDQGDWVLIDAGDAIVHIFRPEVREFYQLEKMWQPTSKASV